MPATAPFIITAYVCMVTGTRAAQIDGSHDVGVTSPTLSDGTQYGEPPETTAVVPSVHGKKKRVCAAAAMMSAPRMTYHHVCSRKPSRGSAAAPGSMAASDGYAPCGSLYDRAAASTTISLSATTACGSPALTRRRSSAGRVSADVGTVTDAPVSELRSTTTLVAAAGADAADTVIFARGSECASSADAELAVSARADASG